MGIGEFARLSRLSPKALRIYDELGLLEPTKVDPYSGYRSYSADQLTAARLVASLRRLGMPLAQIQQIVGEPPAATAGLVRAYWTAMESEHASRRQLAAYLVDRLNGKRNVMYDVAVRDIPARTVVCLLRHAADEAAVWALGKELIGLSREHKIPRLDGVAGAMFLIYYGEVSADSDGPVEVCKPVPADQAEQIAAATGLTLRTEPAHEEAYVRVGSEKMSAAQWELVTQSLQDWAAAEHRLPSQLGVRLTFTVASPPTPDSAPILDFAVPLRDPGDRTGGESVLGSS